MPKRPPSHRPPRARTPQPEERGNSTERGYNWRWRKARAVYLASHPSCEACLQERRATPATVVDHRVPHRGNQTLFWDEGNWQPLCDRCHNIKTGRGQ